MEEVPSSENGFHSAHAGLLLRSYETLTGRVLLQGGAPDEVARQLYEAPFFVASHTGGDDPILTYGNRCALELFEMEWGEFTQTPSRFTAESPERAERERLLKAVSEKGYIDDYSGVRISKSGRRFRIQNATVWNLLDPASNLVTGQAATFSSWEYL